MIQATLFQLDDYGPWTTMPAPRREMDLQTLQSRLYADIATFVGTQAGYVFYTRADNMLAITNDMDQAAHETLQAMIRNRYPVTLSAGIGIGPTPRAAVADASKQLQAAGSAQDSTRTEVCRGQTLAEPGSLHVAHFDVVDATGQYTDQEDAFGTFLTITHAYGMVAERLYQEYDGLAFFVGGDNIVAICPPLAERVYEPILRAIRQTIGVDLRVGVGHGVTTAMAGMDAKQALEVARETSQTVVSPDTSTAASVEVRR